MLALRVTVPIACFRKGFAREYWETEDLPPPSTCYGFLLSMVGEVDRRRHVGARVCPALIRKDDKRSRVLRTLWRVKDRKALPGTGTNARPDYQELLTNLELAVWLDSTDESGSSPTLEDRVATVLDHPERIDRFGGLSLGESSHLVDEVGRLQDRGFREAEAYQLAERGRLTLPVWVDHVGSAGTRFAVGDLVKTGVEGPPRERMPMITPPDRD